MSHEIDSTLVDVFSITLRVPADNINGDFSPEQCATWDSVRHLMLMLAIEEKFGIAFSEKEIAELRSVATIREAVQTHLAGR